MPTPCPSRETLDRLLSGQLFGKEAARLADHLEQCDLCTATAEGLGADDTLVQALRAQKAVATVGDPVLEKLVGQVSEIFSRGPDRERAEQTDVSQVEMETTYAGILSPPEADGELGRLGAYRVLRVLGAGGMGVVFLAEELPLARLVALKVIKPTLAETPGVRERFLREARAIAAVEDDRIVTIHHVGEERGIPFITMQLLHGQTLEERLREMEQATGRRMLPIDEALRIGGEIARGLSAAHARGVIHRDIKPGNIFLKEGVSVKLLDFGLARDLDDETSLTHPGQLAGTPAYVAPEQLAGHTLDQRVDLYGLGCVLYRMTTGQTPFGSSPQRAGSRNRSVAPPHELNSDVPPELSALVLRLLSRNPSERPSSAGDVADRLSEIAHVLSTHTTSPAGTRGNADRQETRRSVLKVTAAAAVVALAAIIIIQINTDRGKLSVSVEKKPEAGPTGRGDSTGQAPQTSPFEDWVQRVATLAPEQQVEAVGQKLKELNPEFDGQIGPRFEGGAVVEIHLITDSVNDLSPVRALPALEYLVCRGSAAGKGRLTDLSPVKSLKSLKYLDCSANPIRELFPLRGSSLRELVCWASPIADLEPLRHLPLTMLDLDWTLVSDLAPLRDVPLKRFFVRAPFVTSLDVVEQMPLVSIECNFRPERHTGLLRKIGTLRRINDQPVEDFWKQQDSRRKSLEEWLPRVSALPAEQQVEEVTAKLRELNPEFKDRIFPTIENDEVVKLTFFVDRVTDIAPVQALTKLKHLVVRSGVEGEKGPLFDLDPIRTLPIEHLVCPMTNVSDLSALSGMSIKALTCDGSWVRDLSPLRTLRISYLSCRSAPIKDLSPLKGLGITYLDLTGCKITDFSPLAEVPVYTLFGDFDIQRDGEILKSIKTLAVINGKPAAEFFNPEKTENK